MASLVGLEKSPVLDPNAKKAPRLSQPPAKPFLRTATEDQNAIMQAVCKGSFDNVRDLLQSDNNLIKTRFAITVRGYREPFRNATLLHLACFREENENESAKIIRFLIESANRVSVDIVYEQASRSPFRYTALDLIISNIANINLAPYLFEKNALLHTGTLAEDPPPLFKMIGGDKLNLIERAFVWASSRRISQRRDIFLNSVSIFPTVIVDTILEYSPYVHYTDCEDVYQLANQKHNNQNPLSTALKLKRTAIATFLIEMGAVDLQQSSEKAVIEK